MFTIAAVVVACAAVYIAMSPVRREKFLAILATVKGWIEKFKD